MALEGVIRLNVPDALLSEIARTMTLSICGDVFLWVGNKRKEKVQYLKILKATLNGFWEAFVF